MTKRDNKPTNYLIIEYNDLEFRWQLSALKFILMTKDGCANENAIQLRRTDFIYFIPEGMGEASCH